ncbi:hypothetical protein GGH92_009911, partial [Coemansia sp. RSA 2673]
MARQRLLSQRVFWQSSASPEEAVRPELLCPDKQTRARIPFFVGRSYTERRQSIAAKKIDTEPQAPEPDLQHALLGTELDVVADESMPDISLSHSEQPVLNCIQDNRHSQLSKWTKNLRHRINRKAEWASRFQSDHFSSYVLVGVLLAIIVYQALMSTLFTRLKFSRLYYNCFAGPEYIPHIVISGIFNAIIGPFYI